MSIAAIPASGQSINQSQLRGTVTDSSGAVVAGATVTITDVGTDIAQSTVSNSHGAYAFTALRASRYKLLAPRFGAAFLPTSSSRRPAKYVFPTPRSARMPAWAAVSASI